RYASIARNMVPRIGGDRLVSAVRQEDLLFIRKELLTGYHTLKVGQKTPVKGRSVRTVNNYMKTMSGMFKFAADSGYVKVNPFNGIALLKRSRCEPDPLTREEFVRMINACAHQQLKNMWSLAVYTGVRHGELVSLAWEDIDLKAGTMMIRRNHTLTKEFTLPKTEAGADRII
ncbi:site-specific integrase, partial [Enterobacter hormaechei]|uniref:site-specific integrase n=1 Tax=Enterobacter hormaechei TaxID=158836 RepID=UPI0023E3584C